MSSLREARGGDPRPTIAGAAIVLAFALLSAHANAGGVGYRDIAVEADGERMVTAIWYPAAAPSGQTVEGPFAMAATRNAPVANGRFGLVLISHGTGGGRLNHRGTAIRLAAAGYIVAAPDHAGDNWRDSRFSGTAANWRRRPRQLSAVLDRLLGDPEFGARIDRRRIGAIGHSAGGYSVLALIGGRADPRLLVRHCTRNRDEDPDFCAYGRQDGPVVGLLPYFTDRRIHAVVAVAPVGAIFGNGAFAGATAPAQIHRLGADRVLRRPWHEDNIVKLMGSRARLIVHPKAHHFAFIAPFPAALVDEVGAPARVPRRDRQAESGFLRYRPCCAAALTGVGEIGKQIVMAKPRPAGSLQSLAN